MTMSGKGISVLVVLLGLVNATWSQGGLQINLPILSSVSNIVNRITDTTVGVVRGGINAVSNTFHNIIYRVGKASDKIVELFEEIRKLMPTGIPEWGIPRLEPLVVDLIDLDLHHEAISLTGTLENINVRQLSKFRIDHVDFSLTTFKLALNIYFPYIEVNGKYDMNGMIGSLFRIYGDGPFWLKPQGLFIGTTTQLQYNPTTQIKGLYVQKLNIDVKLYGIENNFQNLMADEETGEIFNKAITALAPEAVDIIWPELKNSTEEQVKEIINKILQDSTINTILGRLLNIFNVSSG